MSKPGDQDSNRPYTIEELSNATADYRHALGNLKAMQVLLNGAKEKMQSHQRDAEVLQAEVDRHEAAVYKITRNVEKR